MHDTTEIRFEMPADDVAVLDGYCQGTGKSRPEVIKELIREWSRGKLREAMVICRVAGANPRAPEPPRKCAPLAPKAEG